MTGVSPGSEVMRPFAALSDAVPDEPRLDDGYSLRSDWMSQNDPVSGRERPSHIFIYEAELDEIRAAVIRLHGLTYSAD